MRAHQRKAGVLLVEHWGLPDDLARTLADGGQLLPPKLTMANLACVSAGALADREGFYLRHELPGRRRGHRRCRPKRALAISELQVRRAVDRLKEAVRLRE